MNIDVKRTPDALKVVGGFAFSEEFAFSTHFPTAGLRLQVSFKEDELDKLEGDDMSVTMMLSRQEAQAFAQALVDCLCDG